jgi:hypothetical protein
MERVAEIFGARRLTVLGAGAETSSRASIMVDPFLVFGNLPERLKQAQKRLRG